MSGTGYVPLLVKSNFSFLEGASHPDELIIQAHALGLQAIALTDRDGVHGIVRAHMQAQERGLRLRDRRAGHARGRHITWSRCAKTVWATAICVSCSRAGASAARRASRA